MQDVGQGFCFAAGGREVTTDRASGRYTRPMIRNALLVGRCDAPSRLLLSACLMLVLLALGGCKTRSLVAVRESGDWWFKQGDYSAAKTEYLEYVERAPGNAHVHHMLGNSYVKLGETGLGREQLYVAHTLRVEDDRIFADLCEALYQDKKYDDLNRLLRSRTVDRGRMQDWALLATYADKLNDRDEAQRGWLTAAQVDGGRSVEPQLGLAKLYAKVGDRDRARQRLGMAYAIDPNNQEVVRMIRELGEIPGPTFAVPPAEAFSDGSSAGELPTDVPAGEPGR